MCGNGSLLLTDQWQSLAMHQTRHHIGIQTQTIESRRTAVARGDAQQDKTSRFVDEQSSLSLTVSFSLSLVLSKYSKRAAWQGLMCYLIGGSSKQKIVTAKKTSQMRLMT